MKTMGYGDGYKYNPDFVNGRVKQEYLPEALRGRSFLDDVDLGSKVDPDLEDGDGDEDDDGEGEDGEDDLRPEVED
jgi:putative ATPase